ncbi:MAG: HNH endonuclease, partial [Nocardioidaceae bacterium]
EQGVAAWAHLDRAARAAKATGDLRSLAQLRADLLVQRLTGESSAELVPLEVNLIMTPGTLFDDQDHTAARLDGYGPIPAGLARQLVAGSDANIHLRRLFTDPENGTLVGLDQRRRLFPGALRRLVARRDQHCRMPYCAAPVAHLDHIDPHRRGGATTTANGQGLCEHHNHSKELAGWHTHLLSERPHRVVVTTPTGHTYESAAPCALGP